MTDPLKRAAFLACLVGVAPIGLAAQAVDTVLVTLGTDSAIVRQRLSPEAGEVEAFAMRLEEQTLRMDEVVREGESLLDAELTPGERAYRIAIVSGAPVQLRYTVRGSVERIPLFVAGGRAELAVVHELEAPFLIRIEAGPLELAALDLPTTLPRFTRVDGGLEVALSSVPALIRLSRGGPLSFTRISDAIVVALILAGAIWTWRSARARRQSGSSTVGASGDAGTGAQ